MNTSNLLIVLLAVMVITGCQIDIPMTSLTPDQSVTVAINATTPTAVPTEEPAVTTPLTQSQPLQTETSQLAFMAPGLGGDYDIFVMNEDGTRRANLTEHRAGDVLPAWSVDGQQIAFVSDRDGDSEIYRMNADGSNVVQLTNNPASDFAPTWLPDGRIGFISDRDKPFYSIYVMAADGSNLNRLTTTAAEHMMPDWSPDGSQVAFITDLDGNFEIYVMNADGSEPHNLTNHAAADTQPNWSPDGKQIVFISDRFGNADIYVINSDGSGLVQVTHAPSHEYGAIWSPDGKRFAFVAESNNVPSTKMMNIDGSDETSLLINGPAFDFAWRPIGSPLLESAGQQLQRSSAISSTTPIRTNGDPSNQVAAVFTSAELGVTVHHPVGWFAAQNLEMETILLADDFETFRKGDQFAYSEAIGILIVPLPSASAAEVVAGITTRVENQTELAAPVEIINQDNYEIAFAEYLASSVGSGVQVYYFVGAVTNGNRSVSLFTAVTVERQAEIRPLFRAIVESVELAP